VLQQITATKINSSIKYLIFAKKAYIMRAGFVGGHEINPMNPARPRGFPIKYAAMANFV